jgi:drug/metabolite transporter (DMT)-like permease
VGSIPITRFFATLFMKGDMLAFTAMISWGFYSAIIKKIGEWDYPTAAVTRRIYFYGMLFLIPVLMWQGVSWDVTVVLSVVILHEKMTFVSVTGALLILLGLIVSQKKINQKK